MKGTPLVRASLELVDSASLNVFRAAFGMLLLAETFRFFAHGWISDHYLTPELLFKYDGLEWVAPWPGSGLYWHFGVMGVLAAMIAVGFVYRIAAIGFSLAFAYVFLLEQSSYLNQYYLVLSVAFILCFVPAERGWSIDARLARTPGPQGVPRWAVWALRLQFEVMLVYAGLVKINDDWLRGAPLGMWLDAYAHWPLVGPLLQLPWVGVAAAWAVMLLHIAGALLLLHRRYRFAMFLVYVVFHLISAILFQIGLFPWLMLAGTLMFFDPGWPRKVRSWLDGIEPVALHRAPVSRRGAAPGMLTLVLLAIFFALQLLMPLRSALYPGDVAWTGEGEWFAWRMKLDDKRAEARFIVTDPETGRRWEVDPARHLRARQVEMMAPRPAMIVQFAKHLEQTWVAREGVRDVEVRAVVMSSLNGRPAAPLIDPNVDLTDVSQTSSPRAWILPRPAFLTIPFKG
jgi:vitamin K-dependent gamma-carboxylase